MMVNKPTCKIDAYGTKYWHINGKCHRLNGPAIEYTDGTKCWYINDKCHRLNGPAIEYANGTKVWFINGFHVNEEMTQWAKENGINLDNLTEVDKALIKIVWADYGK